jgi:hypothetical protein
MLAIHTQPTFFLCILFLHLQDKQDNVTSAACAEEVFYYQLMEVTDFRNDVILAEACRGDVEKYCKDVEPGGEGSVSILGSHRSSLQPRYIHGSAYHRIHPAMHTTALPAHLGVAQPPVHCVQVGAACIPA